VKWFRRIGAAAGALERQAPSAHTLLSAVAVAGLAVSIAIWPQHAQTALMHLHDAIGTYLIKN
jgi:hypothetical protein